MTLPSSGPMTLEMIRAEFGGGYPIHLSNYYAGGPYVPSGTVGANGPVPTGGGISLWHFYGTTRYSDRALVNAIYSPVYGLVGYSGPAGVGSIDDNYFSPLGATIAVLCWQVDNSVVFSVYGTLGNGGWTRMRVRGVDFYRTSAVFQHYAGQTQWYWPGSPEVFSHGVQEEVLFYI